MARSQNPEAQQDTDDSAEAGRHATDGHILNLMAVDAAKISEIGAPMHLGRASFPLQITIAIGVLYSILGVSGVAGVLLMVALLPLNIFVAKREVAAQQKLLAASDARLQSSNELIANIRVIKYCAWEWLLKDRVLQLRRTELGDLLTRFIWWSVFMTDWYSIPFIITILTLLFYTVMGKYTLETKLLSRRFLYLHSYACPWI